MALLAAIVPRGGGKLPVVLILVAIDAARKTHLEFCVLPRRRMTRSACYRRMRERKRESSLCMIGRYESRWAPALHRVAALALTPIGPPGELALVLILVAVGADVMRNCRFEIATLMAAHACHFGVLALQRELRLRVIEARRETRFLPSPESCFQSR